MTTNDEITALLQGLDTEEGRAQLFQKMDDAGLTVTDEIKEAMTAQLQGIGQASQALDLAEEARPAAANDGSAGSDVPEEVLAALEFTTNSYGVVLVVRQEAVDYLQGGGAIGSGVLSMVATGAGMVPVLGTLLSVACAAWAAVLGAYTGWITLANKGKGVYITVTWVQIGLAVALPLFATTILLPVVGAIEE